MSWSAEFVAKLAEPEIHPQYLLESVEVGSGGPSATGVVRLSSHVPGEPGSGYSVVLSREGSSVQHPRLTPGSTWRRTFGSFTVAMLGSALAQRRAIVRGMVVQVRMGFYGWSFDRFERILLGVVRDVRWARGRWLIDCVGLVGGLGSRFVEGVVEGPLYHDLASTTNVTTWVAGSSTTLQLTDATGFEESSASGGEGYLLLVTPTVGDPFYLLAAGRAANVFSSITEDVFGTTAVNAAPGSTVQCVAYTSDHPITVALRTLLSTGNGGNGRPDLLPTSWGYGLPADLVDIDDADAFLGLSDVSSGSHDWALVRPDAVDDGGGMLEGFLAPGGFFLSLHQGAITVRAVVVPLDGPTHDSITLTDDDLVDITAHSTYSPDLPVEIGSTMVDIRGALSDLRIDSTTTETRPAVSTAVIGDLVDVWSNNALQADAVADRLSRWATRIPEDLEVVTRGLRAAVVSVGSVVYVSSEHLHGRSGEPGDQYDQRPCLVLGGGPDWFGATVSLQLAALPAEV